MKHLVLLGLGLFLGATVASIVLNALARRAAYARGVMQVMQHEYGDLRSRLRDAHCTSIDASATRTMLAQMTERIGAAEYGEARPAAPFREYTDRLSAAVAELPSQVAPCAAVAPIAAQVGDACDACHHQYR